MAGDDCAILCFGARYGQIFGSWHPGGIFAPGGWCGFLNNTASWWCCVLALSCIRAIVDEAVLLLLFLGLRLCAGPHRLRLRLFAIIYEYYSVFARVVEGARMP